MESWGPESDIGLRPTGPGLSHSSYPVSKPHRRIYADLPVTGNPPRIRVLDLEAPEPAEGGAVVDAPLAGRLRAVRLQDSPSFTALSYVWGQGNGPVRQIICGPDGASLEITDNCHAALQQIRKNYGGVTIWVDSICINQQDEAEKESQIPLMCDIYTSARMVYIWLGEGTPSSDRAMRFLNRRARLFPPFPVAALTARTDSERKWEARKLWAKSVVNTADALLQAITFGVRVRLDARLHEDLEALLGREWIHRAWTFQEIILASDAVILCGSRTLTWATWLAASLGMGLDNTFTLPLHNIRWKDRYPDRIDSVLKQWRAITDTWAHQPRYARMHGLTSASGLSGTAIDRQDPASFAVAIKGWRCFGGPPLYVWLPRSIMACIFSVGALLPLWPLWAAFARFHGVTCNTSYERDQLVCLGYGVGATLATVVLIYCSYLLAATWLLTHLSIFSFSNSKAAIPVPGHGGVLVFEMRQLQHTIHSILRHRTSSQAHDRWFALGGILASRGRSLPIPNYHLSLDEVYHSVMETLMAWRPAFVALIIDAGSPRSTTASSWVPRLDTLPNDNSWLTNSYTAGNCDTIPIPLDRVRGISGTEPPVAVFGNKLTLFGACQGSIGYKTCMKSVDPEMGDILFNTEGIAYSPLAANPSFQSLIQWAQHGVAYKTLDNFECLFDIFFCASRPQEEKKKEVSEIQKKMIESSKLSMKFGADLRYEKIRHVPGVRSFFVNIINEIADHKRCLFATSNGRLGSGPLDIEVGDQIYLLGGVPLPMVLREASTPGTFTVVGPAYVYGLMEGEALTDSKDLVKVTLI